jgi:murein DD-endopeptidase MepM/ murein hydrolase activator NlpD
MPGVIAALAAVASVSAIALAVPAPTISPSTTPSPAVRPAATTRAASHGPFGTPPLVAPGTVETRRTTTAPRSRFRWPFDPPPHVLRRFAVGPQPWSPGHRGVDLAASAGQAVLAAGPGVVTFAGRIAGVGAVAVGHGQGLRTTYEPVDADVHLGDHVEAGDRLGTVSGWPTHCDACLHWGAIRGETYVDPLQLLGLVPPVLLPIGR